MNEQQAGTGQDLRPDIGLGQIFLTFLKLGIATFGGSVQSWMHREIVTRHHWLDERTFLSGLSVALVLPGANPVNMALYVGLQLRGGRGAIVAVLAMVMPAFCVILLLAAFYRDFSHFGVAHFVLLGLAASGVGATLNMAIKISRRLPRDLITPAIAILVFLASAVMRWPMIPIVAIAVPVSIGVAYFRRMPDVT
jgi:chromate transporter